MTRAPHRPPSLRLELRRPVPTGRWRPRMGANVCDAEVSGTAGALGPRELARGSASAECCKRQGCRGVFLCFSLYLGECVGKLLRKLLGKFRRDWLQRLELQTLVIRAMAAAAPRRPYSASVCSGIRPQECLDPKEESPIEAKDFGTRCPNYLVCGRFVMN